MPIIYLSFILHPQIAIISPQFTPLKVCSLINKLNLLLKKKIQVEVRQINITIHKKKMARKNSDWASVRKIITVDILFDTEPNCQ